MDELRHLDGVAYVRFASVYKNFREARDFESVLGEINSEGPSPEQTGRRAKKTAKTASAPDLDDEQPH
jgi:transcriptional repressor NrdR